MTDSLLASTDIEEALSRVYVQAVAARAGYTTADYSRDRDGIDILIRAGGKMRPAIDIQLKATINLGNPSNGFFIIRSGRRTIIFCVDRARRRVCSLFSVYQETEHNG